MTSFHQSELIGRTLICSVVAGSLGWSLIAYDTGLANTRTQALSQPQKPTVIKVLPLAQPHKPTVTKVSPLSPPHKPTVTKVSPLAQPQKSTVTKLPQLNTKIVPGKRVGAITAKTTYADLVKIFGKDRLTAKKVYGAEGQVEYPGTTISLGRNRSLTVAWKNPQKTQPLQVIINDPGWKTAEGIGLGVSLTKLRQVLGEFKITGLYWDYGNQVVGLSPAIRSRYTGLSIIVDADYSAGRRFPADLKAVTGDQVTLPASNAHWKPLKMHVSGLSMYFIDESPSKKKKLTSTAVQNYAVCTCRETRRKQRNKTELFVLFA